MPAGGRCDNFRRFFRAVFSRPCSTGLSILSRHEYAPGHTRADQPAAISNRFRLPGRAPNVERMSAAQFVTANPSPAVDRLGLERLPQDGLPPAGLTIRRNCSLSPQAALALVGAAAVVLLGIGAVFAWFGLWLVLPFAGIEVAALALAFYVNGRHAGDYERFAFGGRGECLTVEVRNAGRVRTYRFNPLWARVELRGSRWAARVAIVSHGESLEIGRHAGAARRALLARELALALQRARG